MAEKEKYVPLEEAVHEVEVAMIRLALLHLSFSKILVKELGEEKGRELIIRSILEYGKRVGERIKQGFQDIPKYGAHGGEKNGKIYDCVLAKTFREYKEEALGCLYCYVDAAKTMAVNPKYKIIHKNCLACGDDYCTFEKTLTTEKERRDFQNMDKDWKNVDPRLIEGCKRKMNP